MKQNLIYKHTYKQTLHMTTGLKSHLEILSKDRQTLSDLLYNVSQNNPFLDTLPVKMSNNILKPVYPINRV